MGTVVVVLLLTILKRVAQALLKILPPTLLVAHELLKVTAEVAQYVPVPGLDAAANLLLSIWDNVQGVDVRILSGDCGAISDLST